MTMIKMVGKMWKLEDSIITEDNLGTAVSDCMKALIEQVCIECNVAQTSAFTQRSQRSKRRTRKLEDDTEFVNQRSVINNSFMQDNYDTDGRRSLRSLPSTLQDDYLVNRPIPLRQQLHNYVDAIWNCLLILI